MRKRRRKHYFYLFWIYLKYIIFCISIVVFKRFWIRNFIQKTELFSLGTVPSVYTKGDNRPTWELFIAPLKTRMVLGGFCTTCSLKFTWQIDADLHLYHRPMIFRDAPLWFKLCVRTRVFVVLYREVSTLHEQRLPLVAVIFFLLYLFPRSGVTVSRPFVLVRHLAARLDSRPRNPPYKRTITCINNCYITSHFLHPSRCNNKRIITVYRWKRTFME